MNLDINTDTKANVIQECELGSQGPGYVYDIEGGEPNFPDIPQLLNDVTDILEYMCTPEMLSLKKKDNAEFTNHMEKKFLSFSMRYYALFMKLLSGEDITPLIYMFINIEKVKKGELSLDDAEKNVGEKLAQTYIYPKIDK